MKIFRKGTGPAALGLNPVRKKEDCADWSNYLNGERNSVYKHPAY
jgi:hypothetical protein